MEPCFTGKLAAYGGSLEVVKKLHMVGLVRSSALDVRHRPAVSVSCIELSFGKNQAHIELLEVRENLHMRCVWVENRATTIVVGPPNSAKEKRGAVSRLSYLLFNISVLMKFKFLFPIYGLTVI